jgi:hypothetical protein
VSRPQGVASDKQAGQLVDVMYADARRTRLAAVSREATLLHDAAVPGLTAAADALVRCCLRGAAPWPAAVLAVSRGLLQQRQQWADAGYPSTGWGSPVRAHASLLLCHSQLAALAGEGGMVGTAAVGSCRLPPRPVAHCAARRPPGTTTTAEATGHAALLSHQPQLDVQTFPALQATPRGLVVTGAAVDAAASLAVLTSLEQQQPVTQAHVSALRDTLCEVRPDWQAVRWGACAPTRHRRQSARLTRAARCRHTCGAGACAAGRVRRAPA